MLFLDFETRSTVDLKKVGLHAYAHHPDTQIVCTGYAADDSDVTVSSGAPEHILFLASRTHFFVAHNAAFEREMIRAKLGVDIPWSRIIDTAALAARMSLPRKLEALAEALHLEQGKDMAGHAVMLKLARPKKGWNDDEFWEEEEKPTDFATLREYCRQDVEVMRACFKKLLPLSPTEQRLYALTGEMNDRGVPVDLTSIPDALSLLDREVAAGEAEFKTYTGGASVKSYPRVAKALGLPNVKKHTVRTVLRQGYVTVIEKTPDPAHELSRIRRYPEVGKVPPSTIRALELYKRLARSSPAKLRALQRRVNSDGRVRGALIYCGAERTGRWSSGGVQLHNLPRGLGEETDTAFDALAGGVLDMLYEDPVGTIAEALRGFFVGPFLVGDFAQIEARTLNWFAGQKDIIDLFAAKKDVYCATASKIFGYEVTKKSVDARLPEGVTPRFIGKTTELGAGYGLGWEKFRRQLDEVFDVQIDEDLARRIIAVYRHSHQRVVAWWSTLQSAFEYVVHKNIPLYVADARISMGNIEYGGVRYAFIQLPNGRRLYYAEPEMTTDGVRYWGRNIYLGGKWDRVHTYGGKLAENVVQAFSRDRMAYSMLRLEEEGFRLLLTVHDEIVAESANNGLLGRFKDIMLESPGWATGLPVDVETFFSRRYRK